MTLVLSLPTVGGDSGTWGTELNTALTAVEGAINGNDSARRTVGQNVLIPVATRNATYYQGLVGSSVAQTYRSKHKATVDITSLVIEYGNSYALSGPQGDGPGSLTVSFSIEPVLGTLYRGWFGASHTGTIAPGSVLRSDPVGVFIPAGTFFLIRTYVSGNYPYGYAINTARGLGQDSTGDPSVTTDSGEGIASPSGTDVTASGTINPSYGPAYGPLLILGTTRTPTPIWVGVGDSIQNCTNDLIDTGFLWRALNNQWPFVRLSVSGENAYQWAVNGTAASLVDWRRRAVRYGTHIVFGYDRNDLTNGHTLAAIQADLITGWLQAAAQSSVSYQTTTPPSATSSDQFFTLTNQTAAASETVRLTLNAWKRDGCPMIGITAQVTGTIGGTVARCPVYGATGALVTAASGPAHLLLGGVLELADICESARNSGKWDITYVRSVSDAAMTSATKVVTSATASFTSADLGKTVFMAGAGSAGATITGTITAVTNATTVTITTTCSTTCSAQVLQIGAGTQDGIHPDGNHHRLAAVAIGPILAAASASYLAGV